MMDREYFIDFGDPDGAALTTLNMHRDTLISCRGTQETTEAEAELEWEIRLYEFMMKDPLTRLDQYQKARWPERGEEGYPFPRLKREVAKVLGWEIP